MSLSSLMGNLEVINGLEDLEKGDFETLEPGEYMAIVKEFKIKEYDDRDAIMYTIAVEAVGEEITSNVNFYISNKTIKFNMKALLKAIFTLSNGEVKESELQTLQVEALTSPETFKARVEAVICNKECTLTVEKKPDRQYPDYKLSEPQKAPF